MILETNHYTRELHKNWRERIKLNFPDINFSASSDFLSIIQYIDDTPNKYYSKKAFQKYLNYLENIKFNEPELLLPF